MNHLYQHYLDSLPAELLDLHQFVAWRWAVVGGKKKKPPINPHTGELASVTNPEHWGTLGQACRRAEADGLAGIGLVLTEDLGIVAIDEDDCYDRATGHRDRCHPDGGPDGLLCLLPTYTEVSPSGTGVHFLARGELPRPGARNARLKIEAYASGRYITLTGKRLPGTPATIEDMRGSLDAMWDALFKDEPEPPSSGPGERPGHSGGNGQAPTDEAVLAAIRKSKSGAKFDALMGGDTGGYASPSDADAALIALLCNYTDDDDQVVRLFAASRLAERAKAQRRDYVPRTIASWRKKQGWRADWTPSPGQSVFISDTMPKNSIVSVVPAVISAANQPENPVASPPEPLGDMPGGADCPAQLAAALARVAEVEAQLARRDRQLAAQRDALVRVTDDRNVLLELAHHPRTSHAVGAVWALAKRLRRHPTITQRLPMKEMAAEGATSAATMTRVVADLEKTSLHVTRTKTRPVPGRPPQTEVSARMTEIPPVSHRFQDETGHPTIAATARALLHTQPVTARVSAAGNTHGGARHKAWCVSCKRDTDHIVERRRIERCAECQTIIDDTLTTLRVTPSGATSTIYHGAPHGLTPQWSAGFQDETGGRVVTPRADVHGFHLETSLNTDPRLQDEIGEPPIVIDEDPPLWQVPTGRVRTPDGLGYATGYYDGMVRVALDAAPDTWFPYPRWDVAPADDIPPSYGTAADD